MELLVSRLLRELPGDGRCVEIGIGTGRIALPLIRHGIELVGVDIAIEMVRRLIAKEHAAKVILADATHLPFPDHTFTSAIASHVLHLIPTWKTAVDELTRVVKPGGVLLASRAGSTRSEWQHAVIRHFYVEAGDPPWPPGMDKVEQLDDEMRSRGAAVREIEDVTDARPSSISDLLAALEGGIFSACWSIDDDMRRRAAATTREWARTEYGDIEAPRLSTYVSDWRVYRLP